MVPFPNPGGARVGVKDVALDLLRQHDMAETVPVPIIELCNREGVEVRETLFTESGVSGLIIGRDGQFSIYVNRDEPKTRKRFTIAHELGHYILHLRGKRDNGGFRDSQSTIRTVFRRAGDSSIEEREANQFAAALLMPETLVREYGPVSDAVALGSIFGVSAEAMRIRLEDGLYVRR